MTRIRYIENNGTAHDIEVEDGLTLMEGAVRNALPGIIAECGGACACATCHVHLAAAEMARAGPVGELGSTMLEFVKARQPGSRLSCQIRVSPSLEGLCVVIPAEQG